MSNFKEQYNRDDIDKIEPAVRLGSISIKGNLLILGKDVYQIRNVTGLGIRNIGAKPHPPFPWHKIMMLFGLILLAASVGVFWFMEGAGFISYIPMIPILGIFFLAIKEATDWQKYDSGGPEAVLRIYMNSGYVWERKGERKFMKNVRNAIATYIYNKEEGDFDIDMEKEEVPPHILNQGVLIFGDAKDNEIYSYHGGVE